MRKFFFSAFMFVLGIFILLFLLANRADVYISLDPINTANPAFSIGPMPLWAALMMMLFVGYVLGGIGMWLTGKGTRRKATERKHRIKELEREVALATANAEKPDPAPSVPVIQRQEP